MKKTIEILNEYWAGKTVQLNTMSLKSTGKTYDCLYNDRQSRDWNDQLNLEFVPITITVDHVVERRLEGDTDIDYILKFKEAPNLYHYLD